MMLIAGFTLLIVFGMPYLMDNSMYSPFNSCQTRMLKTVVDPELKAEFEERQKSGGLGGGSSTANPLQDFDPAAWLAGTSSKSAAGSGSAGIGSKKVEEKGITR